MIAVAALAAFLALIAALMLNKLIIFMNPQWSLDNVSRIQSFYFQNYQKN